MTTQLEVWRPVVGFENHYEVSSIGRVRSLHYNPPRILARSYNNNGKGYARVGLYVDGEPTYRLIPRLVAQAFIPNPKKKPEVNHIDGNTRNDSVVNLEWVTHRENQRHALRTGLFATGERAGRRTKPESYPVGEDYYNAKLTVGTIQKIREMHDAGLTTAEITRRINHQASHGTVWRAARRLSWRHVR